MWKVNYNVTFLKFSILFPIDIYANPYFRYEMERYITQAPF